MALPELSLAVVGADYPNKRGPGRRFEIALCEPGEPVGLVPEPKNPADPNAIAVFSARGIQIGYLTAERAPRIGKLLRKTEVRAIFQQATPQGAVIRAAFDGEEPELPDTPETPESPSDEVPDFWPDEVWPDE